MRRKVVGRKLLVASVGVASVMYGCEKQYPPGNLMAPPPSTGIVTSGNLVAPPPMDAAGPIEPVGPPRADASASDAGRSAEGGVVGVPTAKPTGLPTFPPGNLMMPPPPPSNIPRPAKK